MGAFNRRESPPVTDFKLLASFVLTPYLYQMDEKATQEQQIFHCSSVTPLRKGKNMLCSIFTACHTRFSVPDMNGNVTSLSLGPDCFFDPCK